MTKLKKTVLALGASLAVLLGGAFASAPAQASEVAPMTSGSTVRFIFLGEGVPATIDLYNTSTTGHQYTQSYNTTRHNVQRVCPKNDNWSLIWTGPSGGSDNRPPGECVRLTVPGTFNFGVYPAGHTGH